MGCIPYINDLQIEINVLQDIRKHNPHNADDLDRQICDKRLLIKKCRDNLSKLSYNSIEYRLYLKMLDGKTVSKAIEEIANENYINNIKPSSERAIYKKYYPKLKEMIKSSVKVQ